MRIGKVKALTDNYRIKGCISQLYELDIFKNAINSAQNLETIDELYLLLKEAALDNLDTLSVENDEEKNLGKQIKSSMDYFCRVVFDEKYYWRTGTKYEKNNLGSEKMKASEEVFQQLIPLYSKLGFEPRRRADLLKLISKDEELRGLVLDAMQNDNLNTMNDLYHICSEIICQRMKNQVVRYNAFSIMNSLSYFVYGDYKQWAAEYGLDHDEVNGKIFGNK